MRVLFHGTYAKHLKAILREGLRTHHDGANFDRRAMFNDSEQRIFLATTFEEADNYARNILPNEFNRRRVAILAVTLDDDHPLVHGDTICEFHCFGVATTRDIPPERIRVLWEGRPTGLVAA